ncbi:MAG TPA: hypothetical protein VM053_00990 [Gemmatimonadaceae bacterium]|nr:hypothetical protein [Gemmatimonadaceae bacterium]
MIILVAACFYLLYRARQAAASANTLKISKIDIQRENERKCPHYSEKEIRAAKKAYVLPDCAQVDPANELEFRKFASVREPIFSAVSRYIDSDTKRHLLILADSGMGKTTFCLNFFDYIRKTRSQNVALISLARSNAIRVIDNVPSKSSTTLILDALDEDPKAISNGSDRLTEIMDACADFALVIVTCRSHFFENDAAIPVRTGISKIIPRSAGKGSSYEFSRLYLLPFNEEQIRSFLRRNFPLFNLFTHAARKRAQIMIEAIPDLSARPMLLALVPELVKRKLQPKEIYELYEYMVQQWLIREEKWVSPDVLLSVSTELALHLSLSKQTTGKDRLAPSEIRRLCLTSDDLDWNHLTTRSLLNRDSEGNLKFAHRSIMEFLAVQGSLGGDERATKLVWTDFMRELLLSQGYIDRTDNRGAELLAALIAARSVTRFPFADAVPGPLPHSRAEFESIGSPSRRTLVSRRPLPAPWIASAVVTSEVQGQILLDDKNNGLRWRILDLQDPSVSSQMDIYRVTLADAFRSEPQDGFDFPSFAEFLTLLRIQSVEGHTKYISPTNFYWLGDKTDSGGYTLVSLDCTLDNAATSLLVNWVRDEMLSTRIHLYAVNTYRVNQRTRSPRALELRVQRRLLNIPEIVFAN